MLLRQAQCPAAKRPHYRATAPLGQYDRCTPPQPRPPSPRRAGEKGHVHSGFVGGAAAHETPREQSPALNASRALGKRQRPCPAPRQTTDGHRCADHPWVGGLLLQPKDLWNNHRDSRPRFTPPLLVGREVGRATTAVPGCSCPQVNASRSTAGGCHPSRRHSSTVRSGMTGWSRTRGQA